jgi:hypothetical protein
VQLVRLAETVIKKTGRYRSPAGQLDYQGRDFDKFAILYDGRKVGEIDVQCGKTEATVRNILIYDPSLTGQGIGKAAYALLQEHYDGKTLRSSHDINRSASHATTGLSPQAIAMWESFAAKGVAEKVILPDGRKFYRACGPLASVQPRSGQSASGAGPAVAEKHAEYELG